MFFFLTAKLYFDIAEKADTDYQNEKDNDKRTALRVVAAQNYFYAAINAIEAVFARFEEHSYNHENRMSKIWERRSLFSEEVVQLYITIERDQRNKINYPGQKQQN